MTRFYQNRYMHFANRQDNLCDALLVFHISIFIYFIPESNGDIERRLSSLAEFELGVLGPDNERE